MNNLEKLKNETAKWENDLKYFRNETIFLNNLCSQAFKDEARSFLLELQNEQKCLAIHEGYLSLDFDSFKSPEFEKCLHRHLKTRTRMTSIESRFNSFRKLCKKLSHNNLGLY